MIVEKAMPVELDECHPYFFLWHTTAFKLHDIKVIERVWRINLNPEHGAFTNVQRRHYSNVATYMRISNLPTGQSIILLGKKQLNRAF